MTNITEDGIPDEFICPITNEIMKNPLMTVYGHSFERDAIFEWLQMHSTCPLSRRELSISKLVTNCALKEKILAWCARHKMMYLLDDDKSEDPDDPRHRVMGIKLTPEQEQQMRQFHIKRQRRGHRAFGLFGRRSSSGIRRVTSTAA